MARIKTDDPELEKSHKLADWITDQRQPEHTAMRLGDIIDAFSNIDKDRSVEFDFGGFGVSGLDSYRGYYSDLAMSYSDDPGSTGDVETILAELNDANGAVFTGYKGGDFRMDRSTPVWVANVGRCHGVAVVRIEDQGYRVIIHTALID